MPNIINKAGDASATNQTSGNLKLDSIISNTTGIATAAGQTNTIAAINTPKRSYGQEVSLGNVAGVSEVAFFGTNLTTPTTGEPIWSNSGAALLLPVVAQTLTISSSNANDTAAGTGMRSATVKYIDFTTGLESTLVLALNGQRPVSVTVNGYACNLIEGASYGSNGTNAGLISVGYGVGATGVPATILSQIPIGGNISLQAIYTVPAGKTLIITRAQFVASNLSTLQLREITFAVAGSRIRSSMYSTNIDMLAYDSTITIAARNTVLCFAISGGGSSVASALIRGYLQ